MESMELRFSWAAPWRVWEGKVEELDLPLLNKWIKECMQKENEYMLSTCKNIILYLRQYIYGLGFTLLVKSQQSTAGSSTGLRTRKSRFWSVTLLLAAGLLWGWDGPLEKKMATHSSTLAWRTSHGERSLVGYRPWGPHACTWLLLGKTLNAHLENKMFEMDLLLSLPISNVCFHAQMEERPD